MQVEKGAVVIIRYIRLVDADLFKQEYPIPAHRIG
jgi:hypothetical protein